MLTTHADVINPDVLAFFQALTAAPSPPGELDPILFTTDVA